MFDPGSLSDDDRRERRIHADSTGSVAVQLDERGRVIDVGLSSRWNTEVPPELLGLVLTTLLASRPTTMPQRTARTMDALSLERAHQFQRDIADLQSNFIANATAALAEPPSPVSSLNGKVKALVIVGDVRSIEIDSVWAESAGRAALSGAVVNAFERAYEYVDELGQQGDLFGAYAARLAEVDAALDDYARG